MREKFFVVLRIAGVVCATAWAASEIYGEKIAPLAAQEKDTRRSVVELQDRIQGARNSIMDLQKLEQQASEMDTGSDSLPGDIPRSSVMVWLPPRVKTYFEHFGFTVGLTRLVSSRKVPNFPGYKRSHWAIDLPQLKDDKSATSLLRAVAELERQDRFCKVTDFAYRPDPESPGSFRATVSVSALVRE